VGRSPPAAIVGPGTMVRGGRSAVHEHPRPCRRNVTTMTRSDMSQRYVGGASADRRDCRQSAKTLAAGVTCVEADLARGLLVRRAPGWRCWSRWSARSGRRQHPPPHRGHTASLPPAHAAGGPHRARGCCLPRARPNDGTVRGSVAP
jgi:hypothetical protein